MPALQRAGTGAPASGNVHHVAGGANVPGFSCTGAGARNTAARGRCTTHALALSVRLRRSGCRDSWHTRPQVRESREAPTAGQLRWLGAHPPSHLQQEVVRRCHRHDPAPESMYSAPAPGRANENRRGAHALRISPEQQALGCADPVPRHRIECATPRRSCNRRPADVLQRHDFRCPAQYRPRPGSQSAP
jgi:hypothetical protein